MKNMISVLIVDDEPVAGDSVEVLLKKDPGVQVVGKLEDGLAAINLLLENKIDLLFLDIQMPELNGFDVLSSIPRSQMPAVVFITAHDQFALRAFEVNAVDYLLKPYSDERFYEALARAKSKLENRSPASGNPTQNLIEFYRSEKQPFKKRLAVKEKNKFILLDVASLLWAKASGSYTELKTASSKHLISKALGELEWELNPDEFIRIHRSVIVNINHILEMEPYFNGEYFLTMTDGSRFKVSRHYKLQASRILSGS
jgi:two-component system, LytTR family, response regulator